MKSSYTATSRPARAVAAMAMGILACAPVGFLACAPQTNSGQAMDSSGQAMDSSRDLGVGGNTVDPAPTTQAATQEAADGWRPLFNGRSLDGWRRYDGEEMTDGWRVEDGTLAHVGGGSDIIFDEPFTDFELHLEWMVEPGGNSGVFYRAELGERRIYHSGPEMQVLDNAGHPDGGSPLTSAGSNYGLHAPAEDVSRPAGEWNSVRIIVHGNHVEHWMNGARLLSYELGSAEWRELVRNSKFVEWPAYGRGESGYIGMQDHGDRVWFRNIQLRELE